jgi:biotin carboxyl carrier protein
MRRMDRRNCTPGSEAGETDLHHRFDLEEKANAIWLSRIGANYHLQVEGGWRGPVAFVEQRPGYGRLIIDGMSEPVAYAVDGDMVHVHCRGRSYALRFVDPLVAFAGVGDQSGQNVTRAPMPGVVVSVKVAPGDTVLAGMILMVIESMKLETSIRAPHDGVVGSVLVSVGDSFDRDAVLITLSQENS